MITRCRHSTEAPPDTKTPTKLADLFNAENGTNGRAYLAMRPLLTSTPHKRRTRTIAPVYSRRRPRRHRCAGTDDDRTPRGRRGRYARTEWIAKARNHSRVASALPHSEGIAYKPPCGENAMCPQVGRMGSIK